MALTDENGGLNVSMPVAPAYGGMNGGFGLGGDWAWIILLLLAFGGGWGGCGGFGGYGGMYEFPWLLNGQNQITASTADGFRTAQLSDGITSIRDGIGNLSTQLCNCCGDMQMALANGFAQAEIANNSRQMANMQQMFGVQTSLQNCCCENRAGLADLKYTVATENCADRQAVSDGIRDLLAATQAQTQTILNQLCSDKIEQKNDTIAQLRSELLYARGQASQDVQTAAIQAGQRNLANEVEQYVAPKAVPAYIVQNPNCCYNGCGCNVA